MAFDLSTAREVNKKTSNFDLSTAKVVHEGKGNLPKRSKAKKVDNRSFIQKNKDSFLKTIDVATAPLQSAISAGGNMVAESASGLAGLLSLPFSDAKTADENRAKVRTALSTEPPGRKGREFSGSVQGLLSPVSESINAARKGAGDVTMKATGSPLLASLATAAPDALMSFAGFKAGRGGFSDPKLNPVIARDPLGGAVKKGGLLSKNQTPKRKEITNAIQSGDRQAKTAGFKLDPISATGEGARVIKDIPAREAVKQGFDESVVAEIKTANNSTKRAMNKMVDNMEGVRTNARFGMENRPSDIAGASLLERFDVVKKTNRKAAKMLNKVALSLKGKTIDVSAPIKDFLDNLSGMGIAIGNDLKLGFKGSDIEGLPGPEKVINNVFERLKNADNVTAYEVHRMKKYIDEQVSYGKRTEGLSGRVESSLKKFRRNLDQSLDSTFPRYDKVNSVYAETRGALDAMQDVSGKKMDLTGSGGNKAVGTLLRRVMSNAQSRVNLVEAVKMLEVTAKKYGAKIDDDIMTQIMFADELDRVFKPAGRTSFQGQISQAVDRVANAAFNPAGSVLRAGGRIAEKFRGINQDGAFKAIRGILK